MNSCIFCKVISKVEDAHIIYENDYVCCFLDKYPINKGHILVVPKIHYQEFIEVDQDSLAEVIYAAQLLSKILEKSLTTDGITVMQNNGVFKDVEHYHMHIIPCFIDDGFSWIEPQHVVSQEEFFSLTNQLKAALDK